MPNYLGSPNAKLVRCTNKDCKCSDPESGVEPWIKALPRYLVREPDEYDKYYRPMKTAIVWYCVRCQQQLPASAIPNDPELVRSIPEIDDLRR